MIKETQWLQTTQMNLPRPLLHMSSSCVTDEELSRLDLNLALSSSKLSCSGWTLRLHHGLSTPTLRSTLGNLHNNITYNDIITILSQLLHWHILTLISFQQKCILRQNLCILQPCLQHCAAKQQLRSLSNSTECENNICSLQRRVL